MPEKAEEGGRTNGGYWHRRQPRTPNPLVEDAALVDRFWEASKKLAVSAARG